jgi:hypothetical protein
VKRRDFITPVGRAAATTLPIKAWAQEGERTVIHAAQALGIELSSQPQDRKGPRPHSAATLLGRADGVIE